MVGGLGTSSGFLGFTWSLLLLAVGVVASVVLHGGGIMSLSVSILGLFLLVWSLV